MKPLYLGCKVKLTEEFICNETMDEDEREGLRALILEVTLLDDLGVQITAPDGTWFGMEHADTPNWLEEV